MADQWGGQQEPQDNPGWPGYGAPPPGEPAQTPPYAAGAPNEAGYGQPPSDPGYGQPPNEAGYGQHPNQAGYGQPPDYPQPPPNYGPDYPPNYPPPGYDPNYPPGYAYAPVQQPQGSNSAAIAGFVLAFFLAPLGLIFSIIGLNKANKTGGNGRGLAIAGLIISAVDVVVALVLVAVLGVFTTTAVVASNVANSGSNGTASNGGSNGSVSNGASSSASSSDGSNGVTGTDPGCTSAESAFSSMLSKIQTDENALTNDAGGSNSASLQLDLAAFTTDVQGIKTALDSALAQAQHQSVKDKIQTMDTDINTVLTGLQAIQNGDTSQLTAFTDAASRLGSDGDALDSLCSSL